MHVIVHMHEIPPIWHTHRGEDKKQVRLELNMYFDKLMHMVTNTHLEINIDIMHQCVVSSTVPKKTMHMLEDELDEWAEPMHWLQQRQEFASERCHHEVHAHPHG